MLEQKLARHAAVQSYSSLIQQKRERALQRDTQRWASMLEREAAQRAYLHSLQLSPTKALKNAPSMPIHMLTMKYTETEGGVHLQHSDQAVKWRAAVRSAELDRKGNSEWNPVTGARREAMPHPPRPATPVWEGKEAS